MNIIKLLFVSMLLSSLNALAGQELNYTVTGTYAENTSTDTNPNFQLTASKAAFSYSFTLDTDKASFVNSNRTDFPNTEVTYTINGVSNILPSVSISLFRTGILGILGAPNLDGSGNTSQLNVNLPPFELFTGAATTPFLNDGTLDFDGGFYDTAQFSGTLSITPPPGALRYTVIGNYAAGAVADTHPDLGLTAPSAPVAFTFILDPSKAVATTTDRIDFPKVNVAYNLNGVTSTLPDVTVAIQRSGLLGLIGTPNLNGSGSTAQTNINLPPSTLFFGSSSKPILNKNRLTFTGGFYQAEQFSGILAIGSTESKLINISTRASVSNASGDLFFIHAGFNIQSGTKKRIFIRGVSPAINGAIDNAFIQVFKLGSPNVLVGQNDNWENNPRITEIRNLASHLIPQNTNDAALLLDLDPGTYSVLLSPVPGSSDGIGLVGIDEVNP